MWWHDCDQKFIYSNQSSSSSGITKRDARSLVTHMNVPNHEVVFENWRLQRPTASTPATKSEKQYRSFRSTPERSFCTQHQKRGEKVPKKKWSVIILHNTEQLPGTRSNGRDQLIFVWKEKRWQSILLVEQRYVSVSGYLLLWVSLRHPPHVTPRIAQWAPPLLLRCEVPPPPQY